MGKCDSTQKEINRTELEINGYNIDKIVCFQSFFIS